MSDASDAALIAATLSGRTDAYGSLVTRHQRRLFYVLCQLTGSAGEAEETAQEAFIRAYAKLSSFDPAYSFFPWLCQIAVNHWRNQQRRERRSVGLDDIAEEATALLDPTPSPEAAATQAELQRVVWRAVAALPEEARQVVVLRHAMELSYEEIVAATGLPMGTVKSRLARARAQLASVLAGHVD